MNRRAQFGRLRRLLLLAGLFAASIQLAHSSEAPTLIERPNADAGPTQVSVGIWVVDINSIDSAQQSFVADVAVVLRWKDSRLAHTSGGVVHYGLEQIWHPRVVIVNETNSVIRRLPETFDVEADGTVLYRQRYVGSFTQPLRLQSFPFDKQDFRVHLVAIRYSPNEVKFVPDQGWVDAALSRLAESPNRSHYQIGPSTNGIVRLSLTLLRQVSSIRVTSSTSPPPAMWSIIF